MPSLPSRFRGPVAIMAVGGSFAFVGTVPVAVTLGMGIKTSATIIGIGFMGFGVMLILPGICWCLASQRCACRRSDRQLGTPVERQSALPPQEKSRVLACYGGTESHSQPLVVGNEQEANAM